ncbi:hypothetical protein Pfo_007965, partial [Paulownia fortunei]
VKEIERLKRLAKTVPLFSPLLSLIIENVVFLGLARSIQWNMVIIPKTSKLERLEESFLVYNFELTKENTDLIKIVHHNNRTILLKINLF